MTANGSASETSPLLSKSNDAVSKQADTSNRALSNSSSHHGQAEENGKPTGGENHFDDEGQYQRLPEVKNQMKFIVPAVAIGVFLVAADQTIVVSAYGAIGSDLKALGKTSWVATSYFLTMTSFQPLYGKFSDIFGRKSALLFAYTTFGLGCLFCAVARNMGELVAARMLAGIGGGGMTTVVTILMSDIVALRKRGVWQGIINIVYASGAGAGAPLGGVFADSIGWRWIFMGQVPMCGFAIIVVGYVLKLPKTDSSHWKAKLKRVDFLGAFVLVCAVFALILGLDRGSNDSWKAPSTIVSLCVSFPLFVLFLFVELRIAAEPSTPGRIIFERSLFACYICNACAFGGWLAMLFYLPLFFQTVDNVNATQAGIRLLPGVIATVSGSLFGGFVMKRTGKYYWLTFIAYTFLTLGMIPILLCTGLVVNNTYGISVGLIISGFSHGIGMTSSLIGLIANAAQDDQAVATACSYLFRSLGSVVSISLSATVIQQSLRQQLREKLGSGDDAEHTAEGVRQSLKFVETLDPTTQDIVRKCYRHATTGGFVVIFGITMFAALSSWFIREKRLSK